MQNEFEKQVQQKMEELNLVPSDPVWQKVEMQIKGRREKRRFVFFLAAIGLFSGVIAYLIWANIGFNTVSKNQDSFSSPAHEDPIKQEIQKENTETGKVKTKNKNAKNINRQNTIGIKEYNGNPTQPHSNKNSFNQKPSTPQPTVFDSKQLPKKLAIAQTKLPAVKKSFEKNKKTGPLIQNETSSIVSENKKIQTPSQQMQREIPVLRDTTASKDMERITVSEQKPTDQTNVIAPADSAVKTNTESTIAPAKTSETITKKKIASSQKWKKTIVLQTGWSQYKTGLFANAYMGQLYNSPAQSGGTNNYLYYPSQAWKSGSFVIGVGVKRIFKSRIELSASLQYHYYSARTKVGQLTLRDSSAVYGADRVAISRYYTNTQQKQYKDKFGIIEVPVSVAYEPFRNFPLQYSIGASYGRLLKSNMLTFDYQSNFYYYNKKNNAKDFLSVFSSLQYRINSRNATQITTGPVIQFTPTELQRENRISVPHLFFWGLKTDISF